MSPWPSQVTDDATFSATTSNTLTSMGRFSWQLVITLTVRCVRPPVHQPELKVWLVVKGTPMLNPKPNEPSSKPKMLVDG
jgi:hypothetical protein